MSRPIHIDATGRRVRDQWNRTRHPRRNALLVVLGILAVEVLAALVVRS